MDQPSPRKSLLTRKEAVWDVRRCASCLWNPDRKKFIAEYSYGFSSGNPSVLLAGSYEDDFTIITAEKRFLFQTASMSPDITKHFHIKEGPYLITIYSL